MNLLDDILHWFFWESLWMVVTHAFPVIALAIAIKSFLEGDHIWGAIWLVGAVASGALIYRRPARHDYE
jgi:hypothetical protein